MECENKYIWMSQKSELWGTTVLVISCVKLYWILIRVTLCVATILIAEIPAVSETITLAAAMDTDTIITLEVIRTASRST